MTLDTLFGLGLSIHASFVVCLVYFLIISPFFRVKSQGSLPDNQQEEKQKAHYQVGNGPYYDYLKTKGNLYQQTAVNTIIANRLIPRKPGMT